MEGEERYVPYSYAAPEHHMRFVHFRTRGTTDPAITGLSTKLGPTPNGRFYNAMELRFDVIGNDFQQYRFRRTIHEKVWQFVDYQFYLLFSLAFGTPDHPDETAPGQTEPPELYDIDTPGLTMYTPQNSRTFRVGTVDGMFSGRNGENRETDPSALQLNIKQQFSEWVEGQNDQGNWARVSILIDWFSVLWLRRSSPSSNWQPHPGSTIARGIIPMGGSPTELRFQRAVFAGMANHSGQIVGGSRSPGPSGVA